MTFGDTPGNSNLDESSDEDDGPGSGDGMEIDMSGDMSDDESLMAYEGSGSSAMNYRLGPEYNGRLYAL